MGNRRDGTPRRKHNPLSSETEARAYLSEIWKDEDRSALVRAAEFGALLGELWLERIELVKKREGAWQRVTAKRKNQAAPPPADETILKSVDEWASRQWERPGCANAEAPPAPTVDDIPPLGDVQAWGRYVAGVPHPQDVVEWPDFPFQRDFDVKRELPNLCGGPFGARAQRVAHAVLATRKIWRGSLPPGSYPDPDFSPEGERATRTLSEDEEAAWAVSMEATRSLTLLVDRLKAMEAAGQVRGQHVQLVVCAAVLRTASALSIRRPGPGELLALAVVAGASDVLPAVSVKTLPVAIGRWKARIRRARELGL